MNSRFLLFVVAALAGTGLPADLPGQGPGTGGATRLEQDRRFLGQWRRVLMIGAHPDDENNTLLAVLSRGAGIDAAYLSLTRGSGGQNAIGDELGTALGVLRTEELQAARRVDGARQFFTRALDFGFSKSLEETLRFWPRDSLVKDVVRIIRRFRPQVIISVWSGTPRDGHGQHQAAGVIAREAFTAAGDASRFPELEREEGLRPWQPSKYYLSARGEASLMLDAGAVDPATGQSYREISARSRSQHRSQGQGTLQQPGPGTVGVQLVATAPGITGPDDSLFAHVPRPATPPVPASLLDPMARRQSSVALADAKVIVDGYADDDEVVPGQRVSLEFLIWNFGSDTVRGRVHPVGRPVWFIEAQGCGVEMVVPPGQVRTCRSTATPRANAAPSTPYYLMSAPEGAMYRWPSSDRADWGEPFQVPELSAEFDVITARGDTIRAGREVEERSRDAVIGEVRRPVQIVPRVAAMLTPDRVLWPATVSHHRFRVNLEHLANDTTVARVSIGVPEGWQAPPAQQFVFTEEGETATAEFDLTLPAGRPAGEYRFTARVVVETDTMSEGVQRIRYSHVPPRNIILPATATAVIAPIVLPTVGTIGYVRGAADKVPEALQNAGLDLAVLSPDALEHQSLDQFRVIVIGSRAYEVDDALRKANPRLMAWLRAGGTLLIQYQQYPYLQGQFEPLPFTIARPHDRVTDETAAVTLLDPSSPIFTTPNRIDGADWKGWVQERGLYFAHDWDPAWRPLLEMHDPGEPPMRGSLLVARVGRGTAVYTGLAFFRELPAAVPGAWRLFANLLALAGRSSAP